MGKNFKMYTSKAPFVDKNIFNYRQLSIVLRFLDLRLCQTNEACLH